MIIHFVVVITPLTVVVVGIGTSKCEGIAAKELTTASTGVIVTRRGTGNKQGQQVYNFNHCLLCFTVTISDTM